MANRCFIGVIFPSLIGRMARYAPSSTCKLALAEIKESPRHKFVEHPLTNVKATRSGGVPTTAWLPMLCADLPFRFPKQAVSACGSCRFAARNGLFWKAKRQALLGRGCRLTHLNAWRITAPVPPPAAAAVLRRGEAGGTCAPEGLCGSRFCGLCVAYIFSSSKYIGRAGSLSLGE